MKKILVIKHGSLGDIVFSLPAMISVKKKYLNSTIHLLTEKKFVNLLDRPKIFNKIIVDNRKVFFLFNLVNIFKLINNDYDLIIDLQNSQRTSIYNFFFRFFSKSYICSSRLFSHYRYKIPLQGTEKAKIGLANQLSLLNIKTEHNPNYDWLMDKKNNQISSPIVMLIPGVSKNSEYKQWEPEKFLKIAKYCESKDYKICIIGTKLDIDTANLIINNCYNVIDMIGTSPPEIIYSLASQAKLILSNDTGPGHIAALANSNIIWLLNDNFISKSNIEDKDSNYKIFSKSIKRISSDYVINYIKENKLL